AIQRSHHVGTLAAVLLLVDRVGVRLRDDPHARPAGVCEHRRLRMITPKGPTQQVVGHDGLTYGTRVVAQLTDLGCRLVDEAQMAVAMAHGVRLEQAIGRSFGQLRTYVGILDVEPVALD